MEDILLIVFKEYIKSVENVCNILLRSINYSENTNLKSKYDFFMYRSACGKMEFEAEGISYRLHGKGCMAFNEKVFIDWDFGYRGRWCGIDPWKVAMTLKKNNSLYVDYYDGNLIHKECEHFIEKGIMYKQSNQYYFELKEKETFKPEFPTEYDMLIVEYRNSSWAIPRNKLVDRFIRKSVQVDKEINKNEDKYTLKFLLGGKEIFIIPYDDVSYPENAVKIMSDEIIKKLLPAL